MPDAIPTEPIGLDVETYAVLLADARHAKRQAPPDASLRQASLTVREWREASLIWQRELERRIAAHDDALVVRFANAYTAALTALRTPAAPTLPEPADRLHLPIAEPAVLHQTVSVERAPFPHSPWDPRSRAAGHGTAFVAGDLTSDAIPTLQAALAVPFQEEAVDAVVARLAPPNASASRQDSTNETLPLPIALPLSDDEDADADPTLPFGVRVDIDR